MTQRSARNVWGFGLGTIGRDMLGAMVSIHLMFYLTDILLISERELWMVTIALVILRAFDALNDPLMGFVVDNTRSRWGKFKPWIAFGAVAWALTTVLIFTDWGLHDVAFIAVFVVIYVLWDLAYTINDISFYGMLPSLTRDPRQRERIGAVARICANIGLFAMVVGVVPVTNALGDWLGSPQRGWFALAVIAAALMLAFQSITLIVTKEGVPPEAQPTPIRELFQVIFKNDQLLWISLSMLLFMCGYSITTAFGLYYFTYIYGDVNMYPIFALVLGVTQIAALAVFPLVATRLTRRTVHLLAAVSCVAGYLVFFVAGRSMALIAVAGVLIFAGQAMLQIMMMLYIAETVEYGQWKFGRRNESVTFSLQPFIYKMSSAVSAGVVGVTLILSGIREADTADDVSAGGAAIFKFAMLVLPAVLIAVSWVVARAKYRINETEYARIVSELQSELQEEPKDA